MSGSITEATMRRYYEDAYTTRFTARVIEQTTVGGHPAVILDQTYFYATSGGQPNDTGTIQGEAVIDVIARDSDAAVVHVLASAVQDGEVDCQVDWARRFDHMQHHTGQHILSQAFVEIAGASTVGFHLSADSVTIDVDRVSLPVDVMNRVEDLANAIVVADRPVTARLISREDAAGIRMRKLPEKILTDGLRVIDIDGFDITACGGTHVRRTGEIGVIKVLRVEKRGDKTRVEFRCGGRAVREFRERTTLVNQLTTLLTCKADEVIPSIDRLQDELKAAQRDLKAARTELIAAESERLIANSELENGLRVVTKTFADREVNEVRQLASKLVQTPGVIALLGVPGEKAHLIFARAEGLAHDMNVLLKASLGSFNGRGGGQSTMAQGGGVPANIEQINAALETARRSIV